VKTEKTFRVEVTLSRRSMYCMSGAARYDWTHGIMPCEAEHNAARHETEAETLKSSTHASWNRLDIRRSLTFRTYKPLSDAFLRKQIELAPMENRKPLQARLKAQNVLRRSRHAVRERVRVAFPKSRHCFTSNAPVTDQTDYGDCSDRLR
jgi:hypothetical protein